MLVFTLMTSGILPKNGNDKVKEHVPVKFPTSNSET